MPELVVGSGILADERTRIDKFHFPEVEIRNDDRDAILPRFEEIPGRKEKKKRNSAPECASWKSRPKLRGDVAYRDSRLMSRTSDRSADFTRARHALS